MKSRQVFLVSALLLGGEALGGRPERQRRKELEAELPAARAAFKQACGCELRFDIKWETFGAPDQLGAVHGLVDNFKSSAAEVCKDEPSSQAVCRMKAIVYGYAPLARDAHANPDPTFDEKTGVMRATTDGLAVPDLGSMARDILDRGWQEREKRREVEAKMPAARAAFRQACGCELRFEVEWATFQSWEHMRAVHGLVDNVQSSASDVCRDDGSRRAVCRMKAIALAYAPIARDATAHPDPTFDARTGVLRALTDGHGVPDLGSMARDILVK